MQAVCFFLSVFFGIMGGYFILGVILSSITKKLSDGYLSGRENAGGKKTEEVFKKRDEADGRKRTDDVKRLC